MEHVCDIRVTFEDGTYTAQLLEDGGRVLTTTKGGTPTEAIERVLAEDYLE